MRIFKKDIIVSRSDLDHLNHVNNVRYIHWIEDVIREHWLFNASGKLKRRYIWVVLNHNITYKNPGYLGDPVKFKTKVIEIGAATSICTIEIFNAETGTVFAVATTKWCLLDAVTHKPKRITEEIKELFTDEEAYT